MNSMANFITLPLPVIPIAVVSSPTTTFQANLLRDLPREDLCSYVRPMTSSTLQTLCGLICTPQSEFSRLATTSCSTKKRSKSTESQVTEDCSEPKESVKEYLQQPSTRPYLLWKQPVKAVHGELPCWVLTW